MKIRNPVTLTAALLVGLSACAEADGVIAAPDLDGAAAVVASYDAASGWDLPLHAAEELVRAFPTSPCQQSHHRQFDFWLGEWNVFGVADAFIGTNSVTSELDGCLVQEHWIGSNGTRGRSLNAYDRETGTWHQDWASQVPIPFPLTGRLRTSGGLEDGVMVLTGVRHTVSGFTLVDRWTWSTDEAGNVIQTSLTEIPEFNLGFPFRGVYVRGDRTPIEERVTPHCQSGQSHGATRMADFLVGSYEVRAPSGVTAGAATIETDLSECLFIEHFENRRGLEAVAFTYYDAWVNEWFRIYVDSEGERMALRGTFEAGNLVLRGTEGSTSGEVEVRITWTPNGGDVLQRWEISRDDGATWQSTATLIYEAL
jgi:hypothetical protein